MAKKETASATVNSIPDRSKLYKLRVTLMGSHIPIWRDIVVPSNVLLYDLYLIIQSAMGWTGGHLSEFTINKEHYSANPPEMSECFGYDSFDDDSCDSYVPLNKVLNGTKKFTYLYDFGDSWTHSITVKSVALKDNVPYVPYCLAGEGECPPEDVGGVWGYAELCETVNGPDSPEKADMCEWLGISDSEPFPPEFNLDSINRCLKGFEFEDPADYESNGIENQNKKKELKLEKTGIPFLDNLTFNNDEERESIIESLDILEKLFKGNSVDTKKNDKKSATKKTGVKKTTAKKTTAKKTSKKSTEE